MYLKVHHVPGAGEVVAACDADLLGVTLMHGDVEVHISGGFYGTERVTEEEVSRALSSATNVNIIGRRVVALALAMGLIREEGCIMVGGVPHALIFWI
ncbi:MAG: DUF424 domain-containing protein [Candidatus Methanoculleus thermohydrogenotrophicum]|nr:DUF424 domain-containing protein [Candidatus Methanoculleus thermohydrogenotrophicum]NLM82123.1 DUF424 domain-containing protein [Candidatus Methanoculleus thermohydrogenotrophicum]HQC91070.1 DUF424 domain-containing protein [Candidatus Methanoculleus thermohydrogenotrophicum]